MNLEGEIMGYKKKTVAVVALIVVLVAVAFYAGTRYEKGKVAKLNATTSASTKTQKKTATPAPAPTPVPAPANQVLGTVATKTPKGIITLTLEDKTVATVGTDTTTKYGDAGTGTFADVTVGEAVAVITTGVKAADGNWVAVSVKPAPVVAAPAPAATAADTTTTKKAKKAKGTKTTDTTTTDTTATDATLQ